MESLFANNIAVIFVIAVISIISYTNFTEGQRIVLLYMLSYATAFLKILSIKHTVFLLVITSYVYLEYLSDDRRKMEVITRIRFKISDYLYTIVFQYHVYWVALSMILLKADRIYTIENRLFIYISIYLLFLGAHLAITQPFKVTTISDVVNHIEKYPIYNFSYTDSMQRKFDILCAFEDKSYFIRKKSYSIFSWEYLGYVLRKLWRKMKTTRGMRQRVKRGSAFIGGNISYRGYSTPEMQLLRNIAVARGYQKHKYVRKIYEIVYSKVIFQSLQEHYERNTYHGLKYYRHYILYVYLNVVPIRVFGRKYKPLTSLFAYKKFQDWSDEEMFIACLGLSFQNVSKHTLWKYRNIISDFGLSTEEIYRIAGNLQPNK